MWSPLPLCLLPDPREGELPALCPQGGLQVGAAWLAVLSGGCPGAGPSSDPELAIELGLQSPGLQLNQTSMLIGMCSREQEAQEGEEYQV